MIKDVTIGQPIKTKTHAENLKKLSAIRSKLLQFRYTGKVENIKVEDIPF